MPRKSFTPERIIAKLRQIDVEYRKDKRPFHPSATAADYCRLARQLCNTSPNPAAMEVAALKSSPLCSQTFNHQRDPRQPGLFRGGHRASK